MHALSFSFRALRFRADGNIRVNVERMQPIWPMGFGYVEGVTHDYKAAAHRLETQRDARPLSVMAGIAHGLCRGQAYRPVDCRLKQLISEAGHGRQVRRRRGTGTARRLESTRRGACNRSESVLYECQRNQLYRPMAPRGVCKEPVWRRQAMVQGGHGLLTKRARAGHRARHQVTRTVAASEVKHGFHKPRVP